MDYINEGLNTTSSLSFMNIPILQYSDEICSTVLVMHGEKAHSCYFSKGAFAKLKGDNKKLLITPFDKIEEFLKQYL